MKKRMVGLLLAVCLSAALVGCADSETSQKKAVSRAVGVDCSAAELSDSYDSHGGFHGDGTTFYALHFSDDSVAKSIAANQDWRPLPLTDNLTALVWGKEIGDTEYAPVITKANDWDNPLVPQVENGYYRFIDRHSDSKNKTDDTEVLNRYSYNFTLAIYDTDNHILYYCEEDT